MEANKINNTPASAIDLLKDLVGDKSVEVRLKACEALISILAHYEGGKTNEVLTKKSDTDHDVVWTKGEPGGDKFNDFIKGPKNNGYSEYSKISDFLVINQNTITAIAGNTTEKNAPYTNAWGFLHTMSLSKDTFVHLFHGWKKNDKTWVLRKDPSGNSGWDYFIENKDVDLKSTSKKIPVRGDKGELHANYMLFSKLGDVLLIGDKKVGLHFSSGHSSALHVKRAEKYLDVACGGDADGNVYKENTIHVVGKNGAFKIVPLTAGGDAWSIAQRDDKGYLHMGKAIIPNAFPIEASNGEHKRGIHFPKGGEQSAFFVYGESTQWRDKICEVATAGKGAGGKRESDTFPVIHHSAENWEDRFDWRKITAIGNNSCDIITSSNPNPVENSIPLDDAIILLDPIEEKVIANVFKERVDSLVKIPVFDISEKNNLFYFLKVREHINVFDENGKRIKDGDEPYPDYINIWNTSTKTKYRIDEKLLDKLSFEFTRLEPEHVYDQWSKELNKWVIDKELKKEYDLKQLQFNYDSIIDELAKCYNRSLLFEETNTSKEIQEEAKKILAEYVEKRKKIEDGETLQHFTYDRKFCPRCGTKLNKKKTCPKCGWPK